MLVPRLPHRLVALTGDGQVAEVSDTLRVAPAVVVQDDRGRPLAGVQVVFRVLEGRGTITGSPVQTDSTGRATAGSWVLGPGSGVNIVEARVEGLQPVSFTATGITVDGVAVGFRFSCAVLSDGELRCWGWNWGVNPDSGAIEGQRRPIRLPGGPFHAVAASGTHACALDLTEAAFCWGNGELGDTTGFWSLTPRPVAGGYRFVRLWAGDLAFCGQTAAGVTYCWGYFNSIAASPTPTPLGVDSVADVSLHDLGGVCVAQASGATFCLPQDSVLGGTRDYWRIQQGFQSTCGISRSLGVVCQRGRSNPPNLTPVPLPGLVADLGENFAHVGPFGQIVDTACAGLIAGGIYCWGVLRQVVVPQPLPGSERLRVVQLSMGMYHSCALLRDGTAWCWGNNSSGELGDGSTVSSGTPVRVRFFAKGFVPPPPPQH